MGYEKIQTEKKKLVLGPWSSLSNPSKVLWHIALLHLLVWTFVPSILNSNPPLDIVESIVWGREWMWGYSKHPSLAIWLTNIAYILSGQEAWLVYALSQISIVITFFCVWKIAREFFDTGQSLLCVMLLEGVYYYNYTSPEFNPNVLQMPLWAMCSLFFLYSVIRKKNIYWLCLGVCAGLAVFTKYFSGLLLLCFLILLFCTKEGRKTFLTSGPYITAVVTSLVLLPHLLWMVESDYVTIDYASARSSNLDGVLGHILHPLRFVYSQFLAIFCALAGFYFLTRGLISRANFDFSFKKLFPFVVGLGPFVLLILASLVFGTKLRSMWGMPIWNLLGVVLLSIFTYKVSHNSIKMFYKFWLIVFILAISTYIGVNKFAADNGIRVPGRYPGKELAAEVTRRWNDEYKTKLPYIGGLIQAVGNIALYSKDKPKMIVNMTEKYNEWVVREDVYKKGALIIWDLKKFNRPFPVVWSQYFPGIVLKDDNIIIPWDKGSGGELKFVWAVIPPGTKMQNSTIINEE